jgi:hypothetical protein
VNPCLLGKRSGGQELLPQPALNDLRPDLLGLRLNVGLLLVDLALGGDLFFRDLVPGAIARRSE